MSQCPSCGRYVGPHEACPYCGARLTGRTSIRAVKIAAVLLATVGLVALWLAAARAEVPEITIEQAGATMNMAYVQLEGQCTSVPSYDPESDYLSFWVDDGTGEILVSAYRAETQALIEQGRTPALGDQVKVAGTLRVREDFLALTLNVPEQLVITRPNPIEREIGAIEPEDQYLRLRVQGEVRAVYEPYEGLTLITLRDESGSIPIAVSEDLVALSGVTPTLSTGQTVAVTATVSLYGDRPQLVPASVADIAPLDYAERVAVERRIGELTAADVDQLVVVRGSVIEVSAFSAGVKLTLDDGSGTIAVLLWQNIYDSLLDGPGPELGFGAEVRVQGQVSVYRGQLEVAPELPEDVQVLAAAVSPDETSIGSLTAADVGRWVTLHGTLGERETFSDGVKFPLEDASGSIILLLWDNVYDLIPDAERLVSGAQVEVTGQIEEYRGELEIVPQADGVRVVVE